MATLDATVGADNQAAIATRFLAAPVRRATEYKKLWNALDVRDRGRDEALRFWQSGGIEGAGGAP